MITRGILHDPASYPEPERFKPERFLTPDGKVIDDPLLEYAFGFGTRSVFIPLTCRHPNSYVDLGRRCPGRYLAEATMWYFIASTLSQFQITTEKKAGDIYASEAYPGHGLIMFVARWHLSLVCC
jgi:cytochrome P450